MVNFTLCSHFYLLLFLSIRLAHYLQKSPDSILNICAEVEQRAKHSIIKRADKYLQKTVFSLPNTFAEKPLLKQCKSLAETFMKQRQTEHLNIYKAKPQHGMFQRMVETNDEIDSARTFEWVKRSLTMPDTEAYIFAAQEHAFFTKYYEVHILKTSSDDKCRICKSEPETITHMLAACEQLAHMEYLDRHNALAQYVHHCICKNFNIPVSKWWQSHAPADVIVKENVEIAWDQVIQTERECPCNRPDIMIKDKISNKALIIDVSCPADSNVMKKEKEKMIKYAALKLELGRMWKMECEVVPIVVGVLGGVTTEIRSNLESVPGSPDFAICQKIVLVGSQRILQSTLSKPK